MDPVNLISDVANYGVAIVIAIYLVWWMTKNLNSKLDKLAESIDNLNTLIQRLLEKMG